MGRYPVGISFAISCTISFVLALLAPPAPWSASQLYAAEVAEGKQLQAQQLVEQLGDRSFAKREAASEALAAMGLAAESALEQGATNLDREIRYRSRRLLSTIRLKQFNAMLERFLNSTDDDEDFPLPGWKRYKERFGDTRRDRELFVEMQKSEPDLLRALDENLGEVSTLIYPKARQLQQSAGMGAELTLADVAVLVFVGSDPNVSINSTTYHYVSSLLHQAVVRDAMKSRDDKPLMSKLMGSWVLKGDGSLVYQSLVLAMQYDLPEGLTVAKKSIKDPVQAAHVKQYAIMAIAKLGDLDDLPLVEALLNDKTVLQNLGAKGATQVRDLALAACVHLAGRPLSEVGVKATARPTQQLIFNPRELAFRNDDERDKAQKRWRELKKKHVKEAAAK